LDYHLQNGLTQFAPQHINRTNSPHSQPNPTPSPCCACSGPEAA